MNLKLVSALVATVFAAAPAISATVTLDFEGATSFGFLTNFYNGGADSGGAHGANYGVAFGGDALAFSNDGLGGGVNGAYYSHAPTPGSVMSAVGGDAALNVASGFTGPVSFYYSSSAISSVSLYSGLNGAGTLLGTIALGANAQNGCVDTAFCYWSLASINLASVAQSIQFGGTANTAAFDNVSLAPVPLPAAAWLLLSGLGGLGTMVRRRRHA